MSDNALIGHNNPPADNPSAAAIAAAIAPHEADLHEAENWCDGTAVENDQQEAAVDALIKSVKGAEKAVKTAQTDEAKPHHDAHKAALARYKPTLDDLARVRTSLLEVVGVFKNRKARDHAQAIERARIEAERKARELEDAQRAAAGDLEAKRDLAELEQKARLAEKQAKAAAKAPVKGLRTVEHFNIHDPALLFAHILDRFPEEAGDMLSGWVKSHKQKDQLPGVEVWTTKEAR